MCLHSAKVIMVAMELLKKFGYFVDHLWHVDDVHLICEQQELPKITDEEAMQVFFIAHQQFDGDVGISWPQLDRALQSYIKQKEILHTPYETTHL